MTPELVEELKLPEVNALNLDGGGSTTFYLHVKSLINLLTLWERKVSNGHYPLINSKCRS